MVETERAGVKSSALHKSWLQVIFFFFSMCTWSTNWTVSSTMIKCLLTFVSQHALKAKLFLYLFHACFWPVKQNHRLCTNFYLTLLTLLTSHLSTISVYWLYMLSIHTVRIKTEKKSQYKNNISIILTDACFSFSSSNSLSISFSAKSKAVWPCMKSKKYLLRIM